MKRYFTASARKAQKERGEKRMIGRKMSNGPMISHQKRCQLPSRIGGSAGNSSQNEPDSV